MRFLSSLYRYYLAHNGENPILLEIHFAVVANDGFSVTLTLSLSRNASTEIVHSFVLCAYCLQAFMTKNWPENDSAFELCVSRVMLSLIDTSYCRIHCDLIHLTQHNRHSSRITSKNIIYFYRNKEWKLKWKKKTISWRVGTWRNGSGGRGGVSLSRYVYIYKIIAENTGLSAAPPQSIPLVALTA